MRAKGLSNKAFHCGTVGATVQYGWTKSRVKQKWANLGCAYYQKPHPVQMLRRAAMGHYSLMIWNSKVAVFSKTIRPNRPLAFPLKKAARQ